MKLSSTAGDCAKYHAIAARTAICNPFHNKGHPKSDAAADTAGTPNPIPTANTIIAAQRAHRCSRNNPHPTSAYPLPTSRAM